MKRSSLRGFTVVELLIVIVVIAILAAITIVAFNGIQKRAIVASIQSDLRNAATQLAVDREATGGYPGLTSQSNEGKGLKVSDGNVFQYSAQNTSYCISARNPKASDVVMNISSGTGTLSEGACPSDITAQEASDAIAAGNMALSASITSSMPITQGSPSFITNGVTQVDNQYAGIGGGLQWVRVDLGSLKPVGRVTVWHYHHHPRQYYQPKTEVSADGVNWITIYDGAVSGRYQEVSEGRSFTFPPMKIRYIRDSIAGSTANGSNHWSEIQAYYQ